MTLRDDIRKLAETAALNSTYDDGYVRSEAKKYIESFGHACIKLVLERLEFEGVLNRNITHELLRELTEEGKR
jgi:hypothetical protein